MRLLFAFAAKSVKQRPSSLKGGPLFLRYSLFVIRYSLFFPATTVLTSAPLRARP